jgi:shikimate dehydrogenase
MKSYALIGFPLGHSFSKKYFDEKFLKESIPDANFDLLPLSNLSLFGSLKSQNKYAGFAVTIPYKEQIISYLDEVDISAHQIGAVNCIKVLDGKYIGYNTDFLGFEKSLKKIANPQDTHAIILGSGGASKAVQYVFDNVGIEYLVVGRRKESTKHACVYEDINQTIIETHTIMVNCTPLGMSPHENQCPPVPYSYLTNRHLLIDLVYNPAETVFLKAGLKAGARVQNGFDMLIFQAEENWKIWNT